MLQLTFNPGLTLTGFRTTGPQGLEVDNPRRRFCSRGQHKRRNMDFLLPRGYHATRVVRYRRKDCVLRLTITSDVT